MNAVAPSIRRAPILSSLSTDLRLEVDHASEEKSFPRRQIIFKADQKNDNVYFLLSGRIKLIATSRTGRELTLGLIHPNEFFGETGLFDDNGTYGVSAEVLEESVAVVYDREIFAAVLQNSIPALLEYTLLTEQRRIDAEVRLTEHVFYDVPRRIAKLLVQLATEHGRATKSGVLVRVKLTHQDIANLVGSTRETTTLILNDFRRRSLIDFSGRRIIVCDIERLADLA